MASCVVDIQIVLFNIVDNGGRESYRTESPRRRDTRRTLVDDISFCMSCGMRKILYCDATSVVHINSEELMVSRPSKIFVVRCIIRVATLLRLKGSREENPAGDPPWQ